MRVLSCTHQIKMKIQEKDLLERFFFSFLIVHGFAFNYPMMLMRELNVLTSYFYNCSSSLAYESPCLSEPVPFRVTIEIKCECYIIMLLQHAKNPEIFESGPR